MCFFSMHMNAQDDSPKINNAVYGELFGAGIVIPTLNYDRLLFKGNAVFVNARIGINPFKMVETYVMGGSVNFGHHTIYTTVGVNVTYNDVDALIDRSWCVMPEFGIKMITRHVYAKFSLMLITVASTPDNDVFYNNFSQKKNTPWFGLAAGVPF
jgi:hypothetical protein